MKSLSESKRQIRRPHGIPKPKFSLWQLAETADKQGYDDIKGRIVGMEYTSRDAALAEGCDPGWWYTVETPAFAETQPHHRFSEDSLKPLEGEHDLTY